MLVVLCGTDADDDVHETCWCDDNGLLRGVHPGRVGACGGDSASNHSLIQPKVRIKPRGREKNMNTESRPRRNRWNLPKPKLPSLGCPRSLMPQPLTASIQLRTSASGLNVSPEHHKSQTQHTKSIINERSLTLRLLF